MPEYLAPGVYVEEVSFRSKSIEGVSTTTTSFVGPTRYGPLYDPPDILTSLADFEAVYGDRQQLDFGGTLIDNYMWHAVRAFFNEGGKRLYVKRIYRGEGVDDPNVDQEGRASGSIGALEISARHPGEYGNFHVRFTLGLGQNVLALQDGAPSVRGVSDRDVVLVTQGASPPTQTFTRAESYLDETTGSRTWRFDPEGSPGTPIDLSSLDPAHDTAQVVTVSVSVSLNEAGAVPHVWPGLPLDPGHELGGAPDSLSDVFHATKISALGTPIIVDHGTDATGLEVLDTLFAASSTLEAALLDPESTTDELSIDLILTHGSDGDPLEPGDYEGTVRPDDTKTGLIALEDIDDISIVAAPGSTSRLRRPTTGDDGRTRSSTC